MTKTVTQTVTYNIYPAPTATAFDLIGPVFGGQETKTSNSPFGKNLHDYVADKPVYDEDTVTRLENVLEALCFTNELASFISGLLTDKPESVSLIARTDDYGVFHQLNIQL